MKSNFFIFVIIFTYLSACAPKIIPSQASKQGSNQEDLSAYRTPYTFERETYQGTGEPKSPEIYLQFDTLIQKNDVTKALDALLDYKAPVWSGKIFDKKNFEGFRIQIYRGKSREAASKARQRSYELFPNQTPYMIYSAPSYRVRVGDFLEPAEYQPILKRLKREFPEAMVVPDIITIYIDNRNRQD
jgi:hypothetical protein